MITVMTEHHGLDMSSAAINIPQDIQIGRMLYNLTINIVLYFIRQWHQIKINITIPVVFVNKMACT